MKLEITLQELGFSSQESKVYLSLLRLGESSVGAIIAQTGFHRDLVYGALTRLEYQGLTQSIEKKKIRHYQAAEPSILLQRYQEKANLAASVLPELQGIFNQPSVSVRIFEGTEGFEEIEKDWATSLKDNEEFYCIGGAGGSWYEVTKLYYKKYHQKLLSRGIHLKTVTFADEAKEIQAYEDLNFNLIRILPKEFKVPSSTVIYADKILIQVFGEHPIAVRIQSQAISESYHQYFFVLWEMARSLQ